MKIISKHGKQRINERFEKNINNTLLLKSVLQHGYSKENFSFEFYSFLQKKASTGSHIKVYKNFIFILSKNKKTLITTYPVPKRYLPIENFIIKNGKSQLLYFPKNLKNKDLIIKLKNKQILQGRILYFLGKDITEKIILDSQISIDVDLIDNIYIDFNIITQELEKIFCNQ